MLDINFIRENLDLVKKGIASRGADPKLVDRVLKVDITRRQLIGDIEVWRERKNKLAKKISVLASQDGAADAKALASQGKKIKEMLQKLEPDLKAVEEELKNLLYKIPNLPAEDVPEGKDESDNVEIRKWGKVPDFKFKPKDHLELGEDLDIIDVERAAKVVGSRFGYLKREAALLEVALINFAFERLAKKGFIPIIPPAVNKKEVEQGLGYADRGGWDQMYFFEKDEINFVSSSEHTILPQHMGETFSHSELPLKYVGFSTCFRREAGTYGKDTRGIFRVHQFDKVEMVVFTAPDAAVSDKMCLELLSIQEELIRALEIPYRIMHCSTGDLPHPNRRMYDLEAWLPGQGRYREITSCSNCTDYQTRRLGIKVDTKESRQFAHALNATALAIGRTIIAILENYQQKDGSVLVPKALQKHVGFKKVSPKK